MLAALLPACPGLAAPAEPIPRGASQRTVDIRGTEIELHTYKPHRYARGPLLITLHGLNRNAEGYLAYTSLLADRHGFLVVAPYFDRERFPTWRYQRGGIARHSGRAGEDPPKIEPESQWTARMLLDIVERVRADENAPELPYYLLGHSAGAQLLSRFAAFVPNAARRIVIANPSTYVWPTRQMRFPYGFGGLPGALGGDEAIRRYLAQPVTIFLGARDTTRDPGLNVTESALQQGANRYERGLQVFRAAWATAQVNGWAFNWRLVEAAGVGHSARRMYASAEADAALSGD